MLACTHDPYVVDQFRPDVSAWALINRVIPAIALVASFALAYRALDFCRLFRRYYLLAPSNA
jgi:hypothetical protein